MSSSSPLVSVIVPTYFSSSLLGKCLLSIKNQTYKNIEIIVVDNYSKDNTKLISDKYGAKFFLAGPDQTKNRIFGAPFQRNFGFKKASGEYLYYVDADMELPNGLIEECVGLMRDNGNCKAIIIAEESFGKGFWAKCKWLERKSYRGDDTVEAPRFFKEDELKEMGYLDDKIGADDWDLTLRMRKKNYEILRTKNHIMHNEGNLKLSKLIKKRFLYGKDAWRFHKKHGGENFIKYFQPFRKSYFKSWKLFLRHPILLAGMVFMRFCEYSGGGLGMLYGRFIMKKL